MEGFVECPRTATLKTLLDCWECERVFQISQRKQKVECLSDNDRTNNYIDIMAGTEVG